MSTVTGAPPARSKVRKAAELAGVVLSAFVAVGEAILFIPLAGASRTASLACKQSSEAAALIQYRHVGPHHSRSNSSNASIRIRALRVGPSTGPSVSPAITTTEVDPVAAVPNR